MQNFGKIYVHVRTLKKWAIGIGLNASDSRHGPLGSCCGWMEDFLTASTTVCAPWIYSTHNQELSVEARLRVRQGSISSMGWGLGGRVVKLSGVQQLGGSPRSPLHEVPRHLLDGLNVLPDRVRLQNGPLHLGAECTPLLPVPATRQQRALSEPSMSSVALLVPVGL
jgi:hypothetical protein